jgi:uncharacterized protein YndB with AHSA1/START domain
MARWLVFIVLFACCALVQADAQVETHGAVTVQKTYGPEKRLEFSVEVPASVEQVWEAVTTTEGLKTWITPDAKVDLRKGGDWLAIYPGVAPGGGTIVRFKRQKELVIKAMAPERFPDVRRERTLAVFSFEPIDANHTAVKLLQTGWKDGKEWDEAFEYLSKGNPMLLNALHDRFVYGPRNWNAQ